MLELLSKLVLYWTRVLILLVAFAAAYNIRLFAVHTYGRVIHEFDPWFNYRAAEYLAANGATKFFNWFDHTVWYPLGRPVGTTIYPGMQFAAVWIWEALKIAGHPMSLNDVCVMMPAWFGVVATAFLGLLTYEGTGSVDSGVAAAAVMSILPAHIMRSVAGGYDNECVAISTLCATFYFWVRSVRTENSWPVGVLAGVAYFAMVATWGGYIYVLNMIGVHAAVLVLLGRYSSGLHRAYSLFFVIGTALAIQIPVVGQTPLRSLEQMGPLAVFLGFQVLEYCEIMRRAKEMGEKDFIAFRRQVFGAVGAVAAVVAAVLFQLGYFGPISSRVRGLFVQHTRTGNPLVDSVAEHQATSPRAYWTYLHLMCYLAPLGFAICFFQITNGKLFLILQAVVTYYFSSKMNRLVLLLGPVAASLGGVAIHNGIKFSILEIYEMATRSFTESETADGGKKVSAKAKTSSKKPTKKGSSGDARGVIGEVFSPLAEAYQELHSVRALAGAGMLLMLLLLAPDFIAYCFRMGEAMSNPSIMFKSRLNNGEEVIIDDYREAYWWLRDNTPEDTRVMAWWDYGYQINGVAQRTSIADGNTWNHEHIATLGKALTSPEKKAHAIARHLADYVLIWAGGGGDDLAKSPHMARIANSVYSDVCPGDPTCSMFGVDQNGRPTQMMEDSLLWKLHGHNLKPGVQVNPQLFQEAYSSKYGLVRIFKVLNVDQESKAWVADPKNWKCDPPGGWYCPGQYPPALGKLIEKRKAFKQLEDFNTGTDQEALEYQKAYHEKMAGRAGFG